VGGMLGVGVFLLSGYDTCIALLFSLRDSLLFQVVVDRETMQRYIPNSESEELQYFQDPVKRRPSPIRKLETQQYFSLAF
jgi:hypothetical protein